MNVTHVVPHIDNESSGPSYVVPRLCQSVARCGQVVDLWCLASGGSVDGVTVTQYRQWPVAPRFAISTDLSRALRQRAREPGIVHNHGLWSMINVAAGWTLPGHAAKLVVSPHGTLARWALNRRKNLKRALWPLQKRALEQADLLHATCEAELEEIRALGLRTPVALIPHGIDVLPMPRIRTPRSGRTLLFLGRIHPKKGLADLLRIWGDLESRHPDWTLKIVGGGKAGRLPGMRTLANALGLRRVTFTGPLHGEDKFAAYFDADLFVLPTHAENFAVAVAEALAHGCPVMVTRGAPWSGLEREGCGWWVTRDLGEITRVLDGAMQTPAEDLHAMGAKGRAWMARDFAWPAIGRDMDSAYRWVMQGGQRPSCVHLSGLPGDTGKTRR